MLMRDAALLRRFLHAIFDLFRRYRRDYFLLLPPPRGRRYEHAINARAAPVLPQQDAAHIERAVR